MSSDNTTAPDTVLPSRQRRRRGVWLLLRDVLVIVVIAVVVSFVIKTFLVRSFYIPSGSMEQTLLIKDRILVDELTPHFGGYQRGDVVVFRDPGGWLPPAPATPAQPPLAQAADSPPPLASGEPKVLNIYNWSDYIADDTIKNF